MRFHIKELFLVILGTFLCFTHVLNKRVSNVLTFVHVTLITTITTLRYDICRLFPALNNSYMLQAANGY